MTSEAHGKFLLNEISEKKQIENDDVLVLGAVIHELFSENSTILNAFNKLEGERNSQPSTRPSTRRTPWNDEFRRLARSAARLIEPAPTLDRSDPSLFEHRVAQIVDHSFNNSQLFSFAKWILILSLAVLGVGSLSYGGLSLKLWSQAGEATQKLQEITDKHDQINHEIEQKRKALVEAQEETIREVKRVIEEKARDWDNELSSLVDESKQAFLEKLAAANTFIEDQKGKVLTSVAAGDAFIDSQKGRIVQDISDANIVIEAQKRRISSDVVAANNYLEAEKKGFANVLSAASTGLDDQKRKFATDLALLLEQTSGRVDPAVKERLLIVAKAAENGVQTIEDESRRKVEAIGRKADSEAASIHQAAEGKKSDLDLASERDIRSIGATLNVKLNDLNQRSHDAGLSIDTIVGSLASRESGFVSAMNSRLTAWDQRVGLEFMRVDDLAKASAGLNTQIKEMNDQLAALLPSFRPALEVAEELKSGTKSGELPFIGNVLEKSAALFLVSLVISVILASICIAISLSKTNRGLRQGS